MRTTEQSIEENGRKTLVHPRTDPDSVTLTYAACIRCLVRETVDMLRARFLTCMELLIRFAQQKHLRSDVPKVAAAMQRGCRCALAAAKWCATVTQRYTRAAGSVSGKIWRPLCRIGVWKIETMMDMRKFRKRCRTPRRENS